MDNIDTIFSDLVDSIRELVENSEAFNEFAKALSAIRMNDDAKVLYPQKIKVKTHTKPLQNRPLYTRYYRRG